LDNKEQQFHEDIRTLRRLIPMENEDEISVNLPQYRGLSFKEFWEALPTKLEYFDYEEELTTILESNKKLWVKKATGLGITEWTIRWIAWNCLKDDVWKNSQVDVSVVVITGANQDLTNKVIGRIKSLFNYEFKTKESVVMLNGCRIEGFPTNHLSPARGLNPRVVMLDEADFFPSRYQDEARTVAERYIPKTNPHILLISTPNLPGGLFERMEDEIDNGYIMKHMDYKIGLNKVFREEDIITAKKSPSFEREYNLKYGFGTGDVYESLDNIITEYDLTIVGGRSGCYGDPAFGSSNFGVLGAEIRDDILYITEANEFPRPSPSAMLDVMEDMAHRYNDNCKIDSAHPGFIRDLEERGIPALPINFGLQIRDHESANIQSLRSKMAINSAQMVKMGKVRIHPSHTKLISQLRAAQFDKKGGINKEELNFDIGDCFIMACWDLKEFDYGHYDVMDNKLVKTNETEIHKSSSVLMNTESFE
tara:strand:- start:273 stop:1709 length:1437 start_codon:yes stop_codon:yes gene_type:complete